MGAYKYMNEIWRKKQSETMRYLQRVSFIVIQYGDFSSISQFVDLILVEHVGPESSWDFVLQTD